MAHVREVSGSREPQDNFGDTEGYRSHIKA